MDEPEIIKQYERRYGPFVHMGPSDKSIWTRYLMLGAAQYAPFSYDLRVGDGTQMPAASSQLAKDLALSLTTKRIDALCFVNGVVRIIEVKPRAGASAVGQLITYRELYLATVDKTLPVEMWLVTDELQPDMVPVLVNSDIHYVEVGY